MSVYPSSEAIFEALSLGVLIPFLSSILPIQRAMTLTLSDSLRPKRSKGTQVSVSSSLKANLGPLITFGILSVVFGCSIFYGLPLGFLSGNYSLILSLFFFILSGMIFGMTLVAYNF
jgi:hypothetical protein